MTVPGEPSDARHQTYANLDRLWASGHPQVLPVEGSPWCEVHLDPVSDLARLRTEYAVPEPDVSKLRNFTLGTATLDGRDVIEIIGRVGDNIHGIYGFLALVADGLQLDGNPIAVAFANGVAQYREVLADRSRLTEPEEVGLFGELLVVEHLLRGTSEARSALNSWLGPSAEEHDFVFPGQHVEVKSTTSERRQHMIGSLSQLVPRAGVPLVMLSIQLTRTTPVEGRTLAELVAGVRVMAGGHAPVLDDKLHAMGWRQSDADMYATPWALRSTPRGYHVDANFPALTPGLLAPTVPNFGLLSDISYRIDVTSINHIRLPEPLSRFVEVEGEAPHGRPATILGR